MSRTTQGDDSSTAKNMPLNHGDPRIGRVKMDPIPNADPDRPNAVFSTHLNKTEAGKSGRSCRLLLLIRPHRRSMIQELWCNSWEEAQCIKQVAADPGVLTFREQYTKVMFPKEIGGHMSTVVDLTILRKNGATIFGSVKYKKKAERKSHLNEAEMIKSVAVPYLADAYVTVSRYSWHPTERENAALIDFCRMGWDPEADRITLDAANDNNGEQTIHALVTKTKLGGRAYRAAVRLIGDGDIKTRKLAAINKDCLVSGGQK